MRTKVRIWWLVHRHTILTSTTTTLHKRPILLQMDSESWNKRVHNNSVVIGIGKASIIAWQWRTSPSNKRRHTMDPHREILRCFIALLSWQWLLGNPITLHGLCYLGLVLPNNSQKILSTSLSFSCHLLCFISQVQFLCEEAVVASIFEYLRERRRHCHLTLSTIPIFMRWIWGSMTHTEPIGQPCTSRKLNTLSPLFAP